MRIMTKIIFNTALVLFSLNGCVTIYDTSNFKEIEPYLEQVKTEFSGHMVYIIFYKERLPEMPNAIGACEIFFENFPIRAVIFDPHYWDIMSDCQRIHILRHELGHCVLNKDHSNIPGNVMFPTTNLNVRDCSKGMLE